MATPIEDRGYARPDVLVSTDWVEQHLKDPNIRVIESNEDTLLYSSGHVPGAVHVDWTSDLNDQIRRDYITREGFETLMSRIGATPDTTIVFYGDKNNWWACYAFWVFQLFGHTKAKVMDGGRLKWEKEKKPTSRDVPAYPQATYRAKERDDRPIRAYRDEVLAHMKKHGQLVDVRSPEDTPARGSTCRTIRTKGPSAVVTSQGRKACRGPARSTPTMERSRRPPN